MTRPDDRIAALEEQVARLQARLDAAETAGRGAGPDALDRRALFRRSGAVLAGLAGAAAVPVLAGEAAAATGDPLLIGVPTNATSTTDAVTGLSANNPTTPVMRLTNTAPITDDAARPVLRLAPSAGFVDTSIGDAGDLMVSDLTVSGPSTQGGTYLNYAHTGPATGDTDVLWGNVYTSRFASFVELLPTPVRVLDTRQSPGTKRPQGSATAVNLGFNQATAPPGLSANFFGTPPRELVIAGLGVLGVVTAVAPGGTGFLTLWPAGPRPNASSINFTPNVTIATFAVSGLSSIDSFYIFAGQATHILFDVVGFIVPDVGQVGPFDQSQLEAASAGAARTGRRSARPLRED